MSEKKGTAMLVAMLVASYPTKEISRETIRMYINRLSDLPTNILKAAINHSIDTNKFFPTIAEIRGTAMSLSGLSADPARPTEAWGEFRQLMKRVGFYQTPNFQDAVMERAVAAIGGWKHLCSSDNLVADRARFIEVYAAISAKEAREATMHPDVKQLVAGALPLRHARELEL